METKARYQLIMKTSIVGIAVNVLLALLKIIIGTIANSIAIVLDGINNMSDAGSSLITITGTALAGKSADKKHPFGYGRMEYLSSLVISALVLYAGISAFVESVKKIIHPENADYSTLSLSIVTIAIVVKLFLAIFTQCMGKKANSDALVASGKDAFLDVVMSITTLVAALIYTFTDLSLEAYLGVIIAIVIIKSGIELLIEAISSILGEPAELELVVNVKRLMASFNGVNGVYDLVFHNYGPDKIIASAHVEVDDTMTASEMDELTREIMDAVYSEYKVYLSALGFYSKNTKNEKSKEFEKEIRQLVSKTEYAKGIHGFYVNWDKKKVRMDVVISLDAPDRLEVLHSLVEKMRSQYDGYDFQVSMDIDFNEVLG